MDSVIHYTLDGLTVLVSAFAAYWAGAYAIKKRSRAQNKLDEANADNAISAAWDRLNKPLMERLDKLEAEAKERDDIIADLRDWIERLTAQIRRLGKEPVKFIAKRSKLGDEP